MAAVKWIFVVIFGLGSAGSLAMAFVESGGPRAPIERKAPEIALRDFPQMTVAAGKAPEAAKTPEPVAAKEPEKAPEPIAAKEPEKAPEPAKTPEPVAAKPPEPKPEPVAAAKPPEPKPEPVAAPKPPEPKPAPVAAKPAEPKPEPVAAAPKPPEPKAEPAAQGSLNLRASDTADVYLDGKKLGGSPLMGIKAKAGNHKVRFDCYDAAGNTVAGPSQTVAVKPDQEVEVEYTCPSE